MMNKILKQTQGTVERIGPDKDIVALTKMILKQNEMILVTNRELLKNLGSPVLIFKEKNDA